MLPRATPFFPVTDAVLPRIMAPSAEAVELLPTAYALSVVMVFLLPKAPAVLPLTVPAVTFLILSPLVSVVSVIVAEPIVLPSPIA